MLAPRRVRHQAEQAGALRLDDARAFAVLRTIGAWRGSVALTRGLPRELFFAEVLQAPCEAFVPVRDAQLVSLLRYRKLARLAIVARTGSRLFARQRLWLTRSRRLSAGSGAHERAPTLAATAWSRPADGPA